MKLVADEGIEKSIVERLRRDGHNVIYVAELAPGLSDEAVLVLASGEKALLLTADKDFGDLVFRQGKASAGVLLVRLAGMESSGKPDVVSWALRGHGPAMAGAFSVLSSDAVRIHRA